MNTKEVESVEKTWRSQWLPKTILPLKEEKHEVYISQAAEGLDG